MTCAGWIRRNAIKLVAVALTGLAAGLGVVTFSFAEGASYLSNDPGACVNCHIMREQYDGWRHASHHAVAVCNDCHVPDALVGKYVTKAIHGYRHSKGFTLQDFHEPIQITPHSREIVQDNCVRCHDPFVHSVNAVSTEPVDCLRCHSRVGHGPRR